MEYTTEHLAGGTPVCISRTHRFGTDALLLAWFSQPWRQHRAVDLGSGCGIVALRWHDRGHRGPCLAVELQPEGSRLLAESLRLADVICAARAARLEPKRLQWVRVREGQTPWLFLLECQKGRRPGLRLEEDIVMQTARGGHTAQLLEIYGKEAGQ